MKYYCKNCKSEFKPEGWHEYDTKSEECPLCKAGKLVVAVPDYETPAQYSERMEEPYFIGGAVWVRGLPNTLGWECLTFGEALKARKEIPRVNLADFIIVIADPSVPPPDGWEPEVSE